MTVPMPSIGHTIAVSRYQPDGPIGYRACYPGAPIYPTRADAEQDWRRHEWGLAATGRTEDSSGLVQGRRHAP